MKNFYNNEIENDYSSKADAGHRKALGQFFTPFKVASFMSEWVLGAKKSELSVLDPAAGFGVFERALDILGTEKSLIFDLWEIDRDVLLKLTNIAGELKWKANIKEGDFLSSDWSNKYDGIIANPPYYKHHYIKNKDLLCETMNVKANYKFSVQTNIYCWFLIKSLNLLSPGGRLAFIVPSEFLNSNYGVRVKSYLMQTGIIIHLINIHFEACVFDNAMTTSVIILAEKGSQRTDRINFYNVSSVDCIDDLKVFLKQYPKRSIKITDLDPEFKWRNYFNGQTADNNENLIPFSSLGKFSRGIATGANEYFTISKEEQAKFKIPQECLLPCITKACHVKDVVFSKDDFANLVVSNKKTFIFDGERAATDEGLSYVKKGEKEGIDKRFLTKNRDPWYAIEKRDVSKIWVSVFGRKGMKFIWNTSNCRNLTCFHAFYPTNLGVKYMDILFIYLNTDYAKKLFDREKREYGNGLEKFEPNDINKSLIINFNIIPKEIRERLSILQNKYIETKSGQRRKEIIEEANNILLRIVDKGEENTCVNTSLPAVKANIMQKTATGQLLLIPD